MFSLTALGLFCALLGGAGGAREGQETDERRVNVFFLYSPKEARAGPRPLRTSHADWMWSLREGDWSLGEAPLFTSDPSSVV